MPWTFFFKELIVGQVSRRSSGVGKKDSTRLKTTASKAPARRVWSSPCALISKTSPSLSYSIYSGNSEPIHQVQMEYWSWNFSLHFFDSLLKCRTSWTTAIIIEKPKSMQIHANRLRLQLLNCMFREHYMITCKKNFILQSNSEPWVICSDIPNTSIRNHPTAPGFSVQKCTEWYWMILNDYATTQVEVPLPPSSFATFSNLLHLLQVLLNLELQEVCLPNVGRSGRQIQSQGFRQRIPGAVAASHI